MALSKDPETRPEFAPIDMGTMNAGGYNPAGSGYRTKGLIYKNGTGTLEYFALHIVAHQMKHYLIGKFGKQAETLDGEVATLDEAKEILSVG